MVRQIGHRVPALATDSRPCKAAEPVLASLAPTTCPMVRRRQSPTSIQRRALTLGALALTGPSLLGHPILHGQSGELPSNGPVAPAAAQSELTAGVATSDSASDVRAVRAALEAGDTQRAHRLLTELLVDENVARARELFAADNPQDGMLAVEEALALAPDDPEALLAFGDGGAMLGELGLGALFFEDALRAYEQVVALADVRSAEGLESSIRAHLGASRSAYNLFRFDDSFAHAGQALALLELAPETYAGALDTRPERQLAEAAYMGFVQPRTEGLPVEELASQFDRAERALATEFGFDAYDPWVHQRFASLYEWAQRPFDAREAAERGLDWRPDSEPLHETLSRLAFQEADGPGAAVAAYERFTTKHNGVGLGHWFLGQAYLEQAFQAMAAPASSDAPDTPATSDGAEDSQAAEGDSAVEDPTARAQRLQAAIASFALAEAEFARCRELSPEYTQRALGYEVICRAGSGWCYFHAEQPAEARSAFLSMNAVLEDGIRWSFEDRQLLSGVRGLVFVSDLFSRQGQLGEAAETFELLRELEPDDVNWHNNAGFFHRDAGAQWERMAETYEGAVDFLAAPGEPQVEGRREYGEAELAQLREFAGVPAEQAGTDAERAAFEAAAKRARARARRHFEQSYEAYLVASELAPEDVRVVNDTALIAVYCLGEDLERAESMLIKCVEMGRAQLDAGGLDAEGTYDLENAWGDAHENLGVLYLDHKNDPETARGWFEQALAIGPDPRPACVDRIRECDARLADSASAASALSEN